jgi:hypothetical protein
MRYLSSRNSHDMQMLLDPERANQLRAGWRRENLSVSSSVGFIAFFGVAVLNGVVMVSYSTNCDAKD